MNRLQLSLAGLTLAFLTPATVLAQTFHPMSGTVRIDLPGGEDGCSGALVRLTPESETVYIMTAGHCMTFLMGATQPELSRETQKTLPEGYKVAAFGFDGNPKTAHLNPVRVAYWKLHSTDLALLEVNHTTTQLTQAGFRVFSLASQDARVGDKVTVHSAYHLRTRNCLVTGFAEVVKFASFIFNDSIKLSARCNLIRGWSGSPVVSADSGEIISLVSTRNVARKCSDRGAVCEKEATSEEFVSNQGQLYTAYVKPLLTCADDSGRLDFSRIGCQLPSPNAD